jgi:hypothetical protein
MTPPTTAEPTMAAATVSARASMPFGLRPAPRIK